MHNLSNDKKLKQFRKYRRKSSGYSMLEAMIIVAIVGIISTFGLSTWGDMMAQKRTRAATEILYDHIKLARSESLKRREIINVSFRFYGGTEPSWCYGLSDSGDCDCRIANACEVDGNEVVINDEHNPSTLIITDLTGPVGAKYLEINGIRGTVVNSGSIQIQERNYSATVNINAMGIVTNCSDTIAGYPPC